MNSKVEVTNHAPLCSAQERKKEDSGYLEGKKTCNRKDAMMRYLNNLSMKNLIKQNNEHDKIQTLKKCPYSAPLIFDSSSKKPAMSNNSVSTKFPAALQQNIK